MTLVDRIRKTIADLKSDGQRPVYLVMSPEKYRLLVFEASEWLVRKTAMEIEMFNGCYIVVANIADIQVVSVPWEQVRLGK